MDDINQHNGLFGIRREDWDSDREYLELAAGHELTDQELENSFLHNSVDAFVIYQLKLTEETRDLRFEPLERVTAVGLTVDRDITMISSTPQIDAQNGAASYTE